jgi:glutaredoxin
MKTVTFYTREGCHLCHEALAVVEQVKEEEAFSLVVLDLDSDASEDKRRAYDWEVPVVELDGKKIAKFTVDGARLLRLLRQ